MSDQNPPSAPETPSPYGSAPPPAPGQAQPPVAPSPYGAAPEAQDSPDSPGGMAYAAPTGSGELGKIRGTGACIGLTIITFGIYSLFYYYNTHEEMKRHTGVGLGGVVALVLAIFVGVVMPFLTSNEVGEMHARQGRERPVSVATGLWYLPGFIILVGPIIWFVKTNGALNDYWRSQGVQG